MFYVSEIIWIAIAFVLLLPAAIYPIPTLAPVFSMQGGVPWLALVIGAVLTMCFIILRGDVLYNRSPSVCGDDCPARGTAIRAIAFYRGEKPASKQQALCRFHRAILAFVVLENCLWISSYFLGWGIPWQTPISGLTSALTGSSDCPIPACNEKDGEGMTYIENILRVRRRAAAGGGFVHGPEISPLFPVLPFGRYGEPACCRPMSTPFSLRSTGRPPLQATAEIAPVVEEVHQAAAAAVLSAGVRAGAGTDTPICRADHCRRRVRHL